CGSGFMDLTGKDPDTAANLVPLTLVEALTPGSTAQVAQPSGADAVALLWSIDGGRPGQHPQGGAPDRDYLFLERLASAPLDLTAEISFTPHSAARGLSTSRTQTLGFIVRRKPFPATRDPFYLQIMHGVEEEAAQHGYHVILSSVGEADGAHAAPNLPLVRE